MIFNWCRVLFSFQTFFNEWIWQSGRRIIADCKRWSFCSDEQCSLVSKKHSPFPENLGGSLLSWTHAYLYLHSFYIHAAWFDSHSTKTTPISLRTKCVHGKFCKVLKSQDLNNSNLEKPLGSSAVEVFFSFPHPLWMSCIFFIDSRYFSAIFWDPSFPSAFFPSDMAMFTCFTFPFHMVLCDQQKLAPCWEAHRKTQASWNKANWARRDPLRLATRSILRWGGWFTWNTGWRCWIIMRGAGKRKVSVGPLLCALNLWTAQRFSWTHRYVFFQKLPQIQMPLSHTFWHGITMWTP